MSGSAILFMLLTMGFVVTLNALCLRAWVKAKPVKPLPPADGAAKP